MVELMNPGRVPNIMISIGTNDVSRSSDEEETQWESMMVCLFTTICLLRETDRLRRSDEHEKSKTGGKESQGKSHQME